MIDELKNGADSGIVMEDDEEGEGTIMDLIPAAPVEVLPPWDCNSPGFDGICSPGEKEKLWRQKLNYFSRRPHSCEGIGLLGTNPCLII